MAAAAIAAVALFQSPPANTQPASKQSVKTQSNATPPAKAQPVRSFRFSNQAMGKFLIVYRGGFGAAEFGKAVGERSLTSPEQIAVFRPYPNLMAKPNFWKSIPTNIEGLDLSSTELNNDAVLAIVRQFPNLRYLNVSESDITDDLFGALPAIPTLEYLEVNLATINGSGLQHLTKFKKLNQLSLQSTTIRPENFKYVGMCPELLFLRANETTLDDAGCAQLAKLSKLQALYIARSAVTALGIKNLLPIRKTIKSMDIAFCDIDDQGLKALGTFENLAGLSVRTRRLPAYTGKSIENLQGLKKLHDLNFAGGDIRDDVMVALPKWLPQLASINIQSCSKLSDKGISAITAMPNIEAFTVGESAAGDISMKAFAQWKKLRVLACGNTKVTDAGLAAFCNAHSPVQTLEIDNCRIDDKAIASLAKLPNLAVVSLNGDPITDAAIPALTKLSKAHGIGLRETQVTADGATRLRNAFPHATILTN